MRRGTMFLWLVIIATFLWACGSDSGTHRDDSGWHIEESGDVNRDEPVPDGLPDEYVDHPHEERVHVLELSKDACPMPEGLDDPKPPFGSHKEPVIGEVVIMGLSRGSGDAERRINAENYDMYIRFPRKSAQWHRFEVRRDGEEGREAFGADWKGAWQPRSYMDANSVIPGYRIRTSGCDFPTETEIARFVDEYSEIEITFHDQVSGRVLSFGPTGPMEHYAYDATTAVADRATAVIVYEFPVNSRPRGPYFAPDEDSDEDDSDWVIDQF